MANFVTKALVFAFLVAAVFANSFPDTIAMCGKGVCGEVGVIKNADGVATAIGPVSADAELGKPGDYPAVFSLCGYGTCITVPVVKMPHPPACPSSIGLCGDGSCKVVPVNTDASGAAVSVGPVMAKGALGAPGSYPVDVGVCCNGVCKALPVFAYDGRKML